MSDSAQAAPAGAPGGAPSPAAPGGPSAAEVTALLRDAIDGKVELRLKDPRRPWILVAAGEVAVLAGGWELVIFALDASVDHVVRAAAPDGRRAAFADWLARDGANPLDPLDDSEIVELERLLGEAT